jgi:hypothetical protein
MAATGRDVAVLWHEPSESTADLCRLETWGTGRRLSGSVLTVRDGVPWEGRYIVECDSAWRTRRVHVEARSAGGESTQLELLANGEGRWRRAPGEPMLDDGSVIDVDLRLTPATNTLPIRRLGLRVGESGSTRALWIGFPGLEIEPSMQTYSRLAARRWRYASGDFSAELEVDEHGLVVRYGDFWREVARWHRR